MCVKLAQADSKVSTSVEQDGKLAPLGEVPEVASADLSKEMLEEGEFIPVVSKKSKKLEMHPAKAKVKTKQGVSNHSTKRALVQKGAKHKLY